jgi:hypothetical protein
MSGAIPPLPEYTFMAWCSATKKKSTGTSPPFSQSFPYPHVTEMNAGHLSLPIPQIYNTSNKYEKLPPPPVIPPEEWCSSPDPSFLMLCFFSNKTYDWLKTGRLGSIHGREPVPLPGSYPFGTRDFSGSKATGP